MFHLSGFADEVSADIDEQLDFFQSRGIQSIDLRSAGEKNVLDLEQNERATIKRALDSRSMRVSSIGSPIGKVLITEPFGPHLERYRRALEMALFFGAPFLRIFSFYIPEGESPSDYRDRVLERLRVFLDEAEAVSGGGPAGGPVGAGSIAGPASGLVATAAALSTAGSAASSAAMAPVSAPSVTLIIENEHNLYGDVPDRCLDLLETLLHSRLHWCFDPANFVHEGIDPCYEALPKLKNHLACIHIKDMKLGGTSPVPAGEGDGKFEELLTELTTSGWDGYLSLEPHLSRAGQFGGFSGPERFDKAFRALLCLLREVDADWN